nr:type II toxin-antitoxin system VapC family toxin [Salinisphaera sp.]
MLDNSVAMRWLFADGSDADRAYADYVLDVLGRPNARAIAPSIWPLEVANVISCAEAKNLLVNARSTEFLRSLDALAIAVDSDTSEYALGTTLELARRYALSAYDAAYLELSLREGVPLATLDAVLHHAAESAGVDKL